MASLLSRMGDEDKVVGKVIKIRPEVQTKFGVSPVWTVEIDTSVSTLSFEPTMVNGKATEDFFAPNKKAGEWLNTIKEGSWVEYSVYKGENKEKGMTWRSANCKVINLD